MDKKMKGWRWAYRKWRNISRLVLGMAASIWAPAYGQEASVWWQEVQVEQNMPVDPTLSPAGDSRMLVFQLAGLNQILDQAGTGWDTPLAAVIRIPYPEGGSGIFRIYETNLLDSATAADFPMIKTWAGQGIDDPAASLRMDRTPAGIHLQVLRPGKNFWGDPVPGGPANQLRVYTRSGHGNLNAHTCFQDDPLFSSIKTDASGNRTIGYMRTYRLAIAATGEFTAYHGGTVAGALAAMVTTLNRVTGIYERELGIRFTLAPGSTNLIFTDPATDPFTNNDVFQLMSQNQAQMDAILGTGGYDLGHVFCTAGGGVALNEAVCVAGIKAKGVSGSSSPAGDPFIVDMVAHEIGHQFGAHHTHNNPCNRFSPTAYEPASGSTIMAYAGFCPPNLQAFSDAYFHAASLLEIRANITSGPAAGCAQLTPSYNSAPLVSVDTVRYVLPKNTPFRLSGQATDPDGDALTYNWEQFDLGSASSPWSPQGSAPIFRSWSPDTQATRYFPSLPVIMDGTPTLGELLPTSARGFNFRLTVRDNNPLGSQFDSRTVRFESTNQAGPFAITHIAGLAMAASGAPLRVFWDVAGTHQPPVNCQWVNVRLSVDSGLTYPHVLASHVPNNGSAWVTLPNQSGPYCRLMVEADDNLFFDISDQFFPLFPATSPGFALYAPVENTSVCAGDTVEFTIYSSSLGGFNQSISVFLLGLPPGVSGEVFPVNPVPGDSFVVRFSGWQNTIEGVFPLQVVGGAANGATYYLPVTITAFSKTPSVPQIIRYEADTTQASERPVLSWIACKGSERYTLELATLPDFSAGALLYQVTTADTDWSPPSALPPGVPYFWRVRAENVCGESAFSAVQAFFVRSLECRTFQSADVPKTLPYSGVQTIYSRMQVASPLQIQRIRVKNLHGVHSWVSDLRVRLIGPDSTASDLFSFICHDHQDFSLNFSDDAASSLVPCPPVSSQFFIPESPLGVFEGKNAQGGWTLEVEDAEHLDGGELRGWGIEVCSFRQPEAVPELVSNIPFHIYSSYPQTITQTYLEISDGISPAGELTYWLIETPSSMQLQRGGQNLSPGSRFTQKDINDGLIRCSYASWPAATDSFVFAAANTHGGWLGPTRFLMYTQTQTSVSPAWQAGWRLFPNPAREVLRLESPGPRPTGFVLWDMSGKRVRTFTSETAGPVYELGLEGLSPGAYQLEIQLPDGPVYAKAVIIP